MNIREATVASALMQRLHQHECMCRLVTAVLSCHVASLGLTQDFYNILGISRSADQDEIKKGYRKMALRWVSPRVKNMDRGWEFGGCGDRPRRVEARKNPQWTVL